MHAEAPAEDFSGKVEKLKAQFNPNNIQMVVRKLIYLARNDADEHAKQRLMPVVRDLIQKVVIGKTPGHQPASLQVHGSIANSMASMEVLDLMGQQFLAAAQIDFMAGRRLVRSTRMPESKSFSRLMPRSL